MPWPGKTLRLGDPDTTGSAAYVRRIGDAVSAVQRCIRVKATGYFNRRTQLAVRRFQKRRKLRITGTVDRRTWKAMRL